MNTESAFDFIVIGAGSAGCAAAAGLAQANIGTVAVLEAGPSDAVPQVKIPFGLLYTMGSDRDWRYQSAAQTNADGRRVSVSRGRMLGGSSSINSMVWFRGRRDDFDNWGVPGWSWSDVEPKFATVEQHIQPARLPDPHPLSEAFGSCLGGNDTQAPPSPEYESAGVFHTNMRNGRRWSAADAFLRPALQSKRLEIIRNAEVDRLLWRDGRPHTVQLTDSRRLHARCGVLLCAGSIGSPAILMRSGIGPANHLQQLGIEVQRDSPQVGQQLQDHPAVALHHAGPNSGYGLVLNQVLPWALSPWQWLLNRRGRLSSNFVEAGAFFQSTPEQDKPDVQVHFIPYMIGHQGKRVTTGSGYCADVCVCKPYSRGTLSLVSKDPATAPLIDLGLLSDERDLHTLVAGLKRLRALLQQAPLGPRRAPEVHPGPAVADDTALAQHVREHVATAYHPVGTLAMGAKHTPVDPSLRLRGVDNVWVADASIMPRLTSANTNAPSMMIGHKAASMIVEQLKG